MHGGARNGSFEDSSPLRGLAKHPLGKSDMEPDVIPRPRGTRPDGTRSAPRESAIRGAGRAALDVRLRRPREGAGKPGRGASGLGCEAAQAA
jgi:hypothetical protein